MPRRTFRQVEKGQCYCVEWPEWHVDCAGTDCENSHLLAPLGEASTAAEAHERGKRDVEAGKADGWIVRNGRWYCAACK